MRAALHPVPRKAARIKPTHSARSPTYPLAFPPAQPPPARPPGSDETADMRLRVLAFMSSLGSASGSTLDPVLRFSSATA